MYTFCEFQNTENKMHIFNNLETYREFRERIVFTPPLKRVR